MVKFVMCLTRHPDLSREEFQEYWLNSHGPFFRKFQAVHKAGKYTQLHTLTTPLNANLIASRGMTAEYDGIVEVEFESEQAFMDAMSTEEGQRLGAALLEDEGRFIDHSKSTAFMAVEHEV
ncbi:MAG: EthD domain-containing protein [Candidatus Omnitrophica bacterium]|nr:EthD domain-containing protein [Candidatus Omnitrophota bacterium]MCB9720120.1 EthD domain-containing protein [Candidatus Omnitrophota bacterium]